MQISWHDHPDQAVVNKCVELEKIRKRDGQATYWKLVKHLLKTDPWFTMRVALEWGWLDEDLVGCKLIKHVANHWGEDLGVLFPRGHGKTLPLSALMITAILNNPNIAILQVSRTDDNANKIGSLISDTLIGNDYLQRCFSRKYNPDEGFLPSSTSECRYWGKDDGYALPWRKPRVDPTLLCIPIKAAKAGKHPDIVWVDDPTEKENNDEKGWLQVTEAIRGMWFLLPAHGFMLWTGTRWHDADPLGKAEKGVLQGKQGPFKFIKFSCYEDDNPKKAPTYPLKVRWNMEKPSGYSHEMLENARRPEHEGGLGEFFDAQMRNDPSPHERATIKVKDINIFEPNGKDTGHPKLSPVRLMGIETTGGGLPIFNGFKEHCEKLKLSLPICELTNPRTQDKSDRIIAAIQPIVDRGGLYVRQWMIGSDDSSDGLGYELRRIGKASHDDIADALHNVPVHLSRNITPTRPDDPADLYISVDLAWSEKKRADWTVVMAVAVDHRGNHWVIDYDRFQISSPTGIYQRLLEFYQKFEEPITLRKQSRTKYPGAWK